MPNGEEQNASSHIVQEASEAGAHNNVIAGGAVGVANLKAYGDMPAYMMGLAYNQALHHQGMRQQQDLDAAAGWRTVNQTVITKAAEDLLTTDVHEAAGAHFLATALLKNVQALQPVTTPQPQAFAHPVPAPQPTPPAGG